MTPRKDQLFEKVYAFDLLKIAHDDLESARILGHAKKGRRENVFFLIHQSIEKSLKSFLCFRERPIPMVHGLGILISKVNELESSPYGYEIQELDQFATIRRYTDGKIIMSDDEITKGLELAESVLAWVQEYVS